MKKLLLLFCSLFYSCLVLGQVPSTDFKVLQHNVVFTQGSMYKTDTLTIEKVKAFIAFPKESDMYKLLSNRCDLWYATEKEKG